MLVPTLQLLGLVRRPAKIRSAHAGVVVISADRVLKSAFGRSNAIRAEFESYREAVARWPVLAEILAPISLHRERMAMCLIMDRYQPIAQEGSLAHAVRLYKVMRTCGKRIQPDFDILGLAQVRAGIDAVSRLCGAAMIPVLERRLERLVAHGSCDVGFAHGDFHSRNIMVDTDGKARLIDLDCIRMNGIQQLDALYFVLEAEWSRSGRQWFEQIPTYLRGEPPSDAQRALARFAVAFTSDLALVYLLDRVGQESLNFGFHYLPSELAQAMTTIERSLA